MTDKRSGTAGESCAAMSPVAFLDRTAEVLSEEAAQPVGWWWLSFADEKGFRGACLVQATGFLGATIRARALGCNPGGECKGAGPMPLEAKVQEGWADRLLTREECAEFDRVHEGAL